MTAQRQCRRHCRSWPTFAQVFFWNLRSRAISGAAHKSLTIFRAVGSTELLVSLECTGDVVGFRFRFAAYISSNSRAVVQEQPAALARSSSISSPSSSSARSTRSTEKTPKSGQRNHRLFKVLRMRRAMNAGFSNRTHIETSFGFPHGRGMCARAVANFALHRGSDIVDRVPNFGTICGLAVSSFARTVADAASSNFRKY